jgi:uncharacterized membrane protein YqjE
MILIASGLKCIFTLLLVLIPDAYRLGASTTNIAFLTSTYTRYSALPLG